MTETLDPLRAENAELRARLEEAEETLRAIREGEVDAVVVTGSKGDRVFALTESDNLPRLMVETMNEAGLAVTPEGLLIFANARAAALLGHAKEHSLGHNLGEFVAPTDAARFRQLLQTDARADARIEFINAAGTPVPMHVWASRLDRPEGPLICLVATDLSKVEADTRLIAQLQEHQQQLRSARVSALNLAQDAVTAREQAERAAMELERMRNMLAEGQRIAHLGSFEYVAATRTTVWSVEEYRIYGLDPARPSPAYDVMLAQCIHPDDAALLHQTFSAALQSHSVYELEHRIVRPDGSVRWVYDRALPYFDDRGTLLRYVGATLDITERKEAEEKLREVNTELQRRVAQEQATSAALREARRAAVNLMKDAVASREQAEQAGAALQASEQRIDQALRVSHSFTFEWRPATDQVLRSDSCAPILNLAGDEARDDTGQRYFQRVHPDDRARFVQMLRELTPAASAYTTEYRFMRGDGHVVVLQEVGQATFDETGQLERLVGVSTDVTARKQAESALRQSQEDLARAQAVGQIGSWRLDTRQNVLTWSDENHRIFGVPKGTPLTYETFLAIVHPDDRQYVDAQWNASLRGAPYDIEHRLLVEGQVKWVRETAYLECDEAGGLLGGFGITQDITERRRAEEAIRRAHDELEARVKDRTRDLETAVGSLKEEMARRSEAEERYRVLFEQAPVGIGVTTPTGRVLAANQAFYELMRASPEQLSAYQATQFYADQWEPARMLSQLSVSGAIKGMELRLRRTDGDEFDGRVHLSRMRLRDQETLVTMIEDVTRQKAAEQHVEGVRLLLELFATKESRDDYLIAVVRLLRLWAGSEGAGIRLVNQQRLLQFVAESGLKRKFVKSENQLSVDAIDCPCMRVLQNRAQPEDALCQAGHGSFCCADGRQDIAKVCGAIRTRVELSCLEAGYESIAHAAIRYREQMIGTVHLVDSRAKRFSAETIAFLESIAPLVGEALHRFQVEEELRESELRFRSMFEEHDAAMLLVHPASGVILDANRAAARFYGYSREQLRAMKFENLSTQSAEVVARERVRAREESQNRFVLPQRLASGEVRTVEMHSSPVRIGDQQSLFSIIHDITERKRLEQRILDISEEERQRMGQDLHDSLGGQLTGVALLSRALADTLALKGMPEATLGGEIVQAVNQAISQSREIARSLCPAGLGTYGLASSLQEYAASVTRSLNVDCRCEIRGEVVIRDESLATHLFRIVQEAVNNALRHGKARRIEIQLSRQKASLVLKVRDDGVGIGPQPQPGRQGMGLHTMRYRAEAIGADLEIEATRPTGTLVSCRLANFSAPQPKAQRQEQPPASRKPKTAKSRRTTKGQQGTS
jgi:PAS domain S-box-containing protein